MATTRPKADTYIRRVTEASNKAAAELGIEKRDIDLIVRVKVETTVGYNEHEDED